MAEPPEFRVVRGNPTPDQEAAIREAILKIWREEQAGARRAAGRSGWVIAARAEATSAGASDFRAEGSVWYVDGGPQDGGFSLKLLLLGGGLARSPWIGFRLAVGLS